MDYTFPAQRKLNIFSAPATLNFLLCISRIYENWCKKKMVSGQFTQYHFTQCQFTQCQFTQPAILPNAILPNAILLNAILPNAILPKAKLQ